jgi:TolB-like protein/Tfp pilus assembly protein PilF
MARRAVANPDGTVVKSGPAMTFRFGTFELCPERYELRRGREPISLEPRVLEVLAYLVSHHDRVVPKHELLDQLWPGQAVSEAALTRTIREARRALRTSRQRGSWIKTVYGRGFRFVGPVANGMPAPERSPAPAAPALPSVAVLPFADGSPAHDQGYFCEGLADELIDALTRIEGLRVAARSSSFLYRGRPLDAREVGRRLNVATVLDGSVRKDGDRLRIGVQLVNVADNYNLWAAVFDRRATDVFAIQQEIAANTARALRVVLSDRDRLALQGSPRAELPAYEHYLRGRQLAARPVCTRLEAARQHFRRAIEVDPTYAPAHAGLADCCGLLHALFGADWAYLVAAEEASRRAVELAPDLAEAHAARAQVHALAGRPAEAADGFETALRLNPRLAKTRYLYARLLSGTEKPVEAAAQLEQSERLDPNDCTPYLLAKVYDRLGRLADAAAARRRCVEHARQRLEHDPGDVRALYLGGSALAALGEADAAGDWIERALALDPDDAVALYHAAGVSARAGRDGEALDRLEQAVEHGFRQTRWIAVDRDLDPVRRSPRLAALLAG